MRSEKLLEAIGEIDENKIENARKYPQDSKAIKKANRAKGRTIIKPFKIVAAVAMVAIIVLLATSKLSTNQKVIYASSYEGFSTILNTDDEKVICNENLKEIDEDAMVRVAVWVRGLMESYSDITCTLPEFEGYTMDDLDDYDKESLKLYWTEGKISTEEFEQRQTNWSQIYSNLVDNALGLEEEYLKEIGAKDISGQDNEIFVLTIKKKNIKKLENGKCKYAVVLSTIDDDEVNASENTLERYYGEYSKCELIGVPVYSSICGQSDKIGKFTINEKEINISVAGYMVSGNNYAYEKNDNKFDLWIYSVGALENDANTDIKLLELSRAQKEFYTVTDENGNSVDIIVADSGIYVDCGISGLYKLEK